MFSHKDLQSRGQYFHFLQRATFGARSQDIEEMITLGLSPWFEAQTQTPIGYHLPLVQQAVIDEMRDRATGSIRIGVWYQHAITAQDQLRQRMAYALSQIFVISQNGLGNRHDEMAAYYDMLLDHSFGRFRDLLWAVTLSPMMGRYLTLRGSRKANPKTNSFPDENYAREVMQLFTLGLWQLNERGEAILDEQGQKIPSYTQNDVQELARALTGWQGGHLSTPMTARNKFHDMGQKVILGTVFPPNQTAEQDLEQVVDLLVNQPNTPVFIANLLIKRFVTSNPRPEYIERVSNTFINNGQGIRGDLQATLWAILTDEDALQGIGDQGNQSSAQQTYHFGLLKEPILVITNQARALNMRCVTRWRDFISSNNSLGQAPLAANSVFNFYLPDHAPQGEINQHGLTAPEATLLTTYQMQTMHNKIVRNIEAYRAKPHHHNNWTYDITPFLNLHADPDRYVAFMNEQIFGGTMPNRIIQRILNVLNHQINVKYGTQRVKTTLYIAFTAPEFFSQEACL